VLHGSNCEDGALQGLLELAGLPYVGAGVLGSAICMDKDVAKRLAAAAGIPHTPYLAVREGRWGSEADVVARHVNELLGYPAFVKPANQGSSVGISRAGDEAELRAAVALAFEYDTKVVIERAVDAREVELAVLGSGDRSSPPEVSLPGEIVASEAFYSYDRKYLEADGAQLHAPAKLTPEQSADAQRMAAQIFLELECEGMARIDLFLDRERGELLFNEANTIPGFTAISMYPKLWEASGLAYPQLLSRLIELALARGRRRALLKRAR
jgi:D-alanine-D-alanine ligase